MDESCHDHHLPFHSDTRAAAADTSEEVPSRVDPDFHIVGIGASAGGLESLERLFTHLPADTGMAFVVLQHLSPDFRSLMDELLGRRTAMRIRHAESNMPVEPNTVYLLPPMKEALRAGATLGEVSDALRDVFGVYQPGR